MRYEIFTQQTAGSIFTGHLHSTNSIEGAWSWVAEFERQGYRNVYVWDREAKARLAP